MNFKTFMKLALSGLLALNISIGFADEEEPVKNATSLASNSDAAEETYKIELRADDIRDNTFPVPVEYFDNLKTGSKLKATLDVPLRLTISNSRKRRLLTLFTIPGKSDFPFGKVLDAISTFKIDSYGDSLTRYNGPKPYIFRTKEDSKTIQIDFILSITRKHFYDGYVKIGVAATNGDHLSEICEVQKTNCVEPIVITIVPRTIEYGVNFNDKSTLDTKAPMAMLNIKSTDIGLRTVVSGTETNMVKAYEKGEVNVTYSRKTGRYTVGKYSTSIALKPVYRYMSNTHYDRDDQVTWNNTIYRPDLMIMDQKCQLEIRSRILLGNDNVTLNGKSIGNTPQTIMVKKGSKNDITVTATVATHRAAVGDKKSKNGVVCQGRHTRVFFDFVPK